MAAGAGGTPPLRLKDLLELDCDSCSAAGFRCYPRRLVGDSSAAAGPMRHRGRRPSKLSHLSRSLSRRLSRGGGFWRRRGDDSVDEEETEAAAAAAAAVSAGCEEEPETTSSSSESSDNSSSRRSRASSGDSDFSSSSASASEDSVHGAAAAAAMAAAAAGDEHQEAMKRGSSEGADDRPDDEQLSPVAVMDFPADEDSGAEDKGDDDADAACAPSFSLERLQRRNAHKIRRLGSRDDLGPVDLEARLAATSDSDPDADSLAVADDATAQQVIIQCRTEDAATPTCASGAGVQDVPNDHVLVALLMGMVSAGVEDDASERLLLDFFFAEMKRRLSEPHAEAGLPSPAGALQRNAERLVDGEAVAAVRGWLEGTGAERWGLKDVLRAGEAVVAEMERGQRWMQVGEEEREVGAVVAGMLVDRMVDEVVWDLLV
ncbi:hypothetical protein BS78_01G307900 [Paspalum vaginatum]|nr:hypothetical protein BS78_01G307900 [Paspalum vaginatum]